MSLAGTVADALGPDVRDEHPPVPDAERVIAPASLDQAAQALRAASDNGLQVLLWGGGTHQGVGYSVTADVVLITTNLNRVVDWQPEDLTIVVESGLRVADLEAMLAERGQSAVLPELPGEATVGGVVATGVSGWRRLRYGPTRDRMLEVVLVTGDGRIVTGGGRVVKNVTGYDLPRLVAGSLGAIGLIGTACLKLWPVPLHAGTIPVPDGAVARRTAYRPLAVIETETETNVYVAGTAAEVAGQAADLGSVADPELKWPDPLDSAWLLSLRVPAASLAEAIAKLRTVMPSCRYQAAHGVGEVRIGADEAPVDEVAELRAWAEERTGVVTIDRRPHDTSIDIDPWGAEPHAMDIQRRVKSAFDPAGVLNPGRSAGRL